MSLKHTRLWESLTLGSVVGVLGPAFAVAALTAAPASAVFAATPAAACAAPWSAATVYNGGATASENGTNYVANWWTQGDDPATHSGPGGSGQPWTSQGACSGGSPTPPPAPPPPAPPPPAPPPPAPPPPAPPPPAPPPPPPAPPPPAPPPPAPPPSGACATPWSAGTAYNGGATVSENGVNYVAAFWSQGSDPATDNGAAGSGAPWVAQGACTTAPTPPPPPPAPPPPPPPPGAPPPSGFVLSPYKDVTISANWNTGQARTAVTGTVIPLVGTGGFFTSVEPNLKAITLAFATGECGSENWAGISTSQFIGANIAALNTAGVDYIISTGGAAGTFTCATPAAFASFIQEYLTPHMIGVDFDIEGGQTQGDIDNLVADVAAAEITYPQLRFSFTLATWAGSDGSYAGLNALGTEVVNAIKAANLTNYTIDLMVMDYGKAGSNVCVLGSNGLCEMGQSAIQAAENLEHTFGIPANKIELTPMIGVNDTQDETFTLADVDTVMSWAKANGLAGVHYWSLDRDASCSGGGGSDSCDSVNTAPLQYTNEFVKDLGN